MNNLIVGLNKFIRNKNTVTILGIVLILALLYFGYNRTVKQTINPVSVPVATKTIGSRTKISADDITYTQVAAVTLNDNVIRNSNEIVGKYTNLNVTIPEGSMFYGSWLVDKKDIPGNWIEEINVKDGYEAYYLSTDATQTLGNNVIPGSTIDIYMMARDDNDQLMYGRLMENIKVMVVHDGSGKDVFADASNPGSPSKLGFQLSHEYYVLLTKAENMSGITLVIAPQGKRSNLKGDVNVSSATLRDYIDTRSVDLTDEVTTKEFTTKKSTKKTSTSTSTTDTTVDENTNSANVAEEETTNTDVSSY